MIKCLSNIEGWAEEAEKQPVTNHYLNAGYHASIIELLANHPYRTTRSRARSPTSSADRVAKEVHSLNRRREVAIDSDFPGGISKFSPGMRNPH
jgi:hypothetical protein